MGEVISEDTPLEKLEMIEVKDENNPLKKMDTEENEEESAFIETDDYQMSDSSESELELLEGPKKCEYCNKCFNDASEMIEHQNTHKGDRPYKCTTCDMSFRNTQQLRIHSKYAEDKPHSCQLCSEKFHQRKDFREHFKKNHIIDVSVETNEKQINQDDPDGVEKKKGKRGRKSGTKLKDSLFCQICDKKFTSITSLETHYRVHTGEKPFCCDYCGRKFNQQPHLKTHMRIHTGEKPFKCTICDKSFAQKIALNNHVLTHTGEKPYTCEFCSKSFLQPSHLKTHRRLHTGEKPYKCSQCHKAFSQSGQLDIHVRSHTGSKPFICLICNKNFTQYAHLRTHERTHTGESPFKCPVCKRGFKQTGTLAKHRLICGQDTSNLKDVQSDTNENTCVEMGSTVKETNDDDGKEDVSHMQYEIKLENNVAEIEHNSEIISEMYGCQYCDEIFSSVPELETHISTHRLPSSVTLYKCGECENCFTDYSDLEKHLLEHIKGESDQQVVIIQENTTTMDV